MSITILAPAFYQNLYNVHYLAESAKRYEVPIWWYGLGKKYIDWYQVQVIELLEVIPHVPTSHILYTDASDAILLADLQEIEKKYESFPYPPLLISEERDGLCAGGWMG